MKACMGTMFVEYIAGNEVLQAFDAQAAMLFEKGSKMGLFVLILWFTYKTFMGFMTIYRRTSKIYFTETPKWVR